MDRINAGMVDPTSLRTLAGVGGRASRIGDGGKISSATSSLVEKRQQSQIAQSEPNTVLSSRQPTPAYIVANDHMMDRLLAGGTTALLNWHKDNAGLLKAIYNTH
jgi:hypothetical protein